MPIHACTHTGQRSDSLHGLNTCKWLWMTVDMSTHVSLLKSLHTATIHATHAGMADMLLHMYMYSNICSNSITPHTHLATSSTDCSLLLCTFLHTTHQTPSCPDVTNNISAYHIRMWYVHVHMWQIHAITHACSHQLHHYYWLLSHTVYTSSSTMHM